MVVQIPKFDHGRVFGVFRIRRKERVAEVGPLEAAKFTVFYRILGSLEYP
jgi:hypothetical protein